MISIAIVGVGYWGPNYARALSSFGNIVFRWCADLDKKALSKMQRLYPTVQTTTDVQDLIDDENLDCVIIVTPAQSHFELASRFLEAGKDVLVEKPLTVTVDEGKKLIAIAKKHRRILSVDHTFLFNPGIMDLRKRIERKELGNIYYLYGQYNALGPIRRDVSAMWDLPHFLYVADFLLGSSPISVSAVGKSFLQKGMEDVVFLNLEYPDNKMFNLQCSWMDPVKIRKLVVVGNKKMAQFDDMEPEAKLKLYDKGVEISKDPNFAQLRLALRNGDLLVPRITPVEPLLECVKQFITAVTTRERPMCDGEEGLRLVTTLEAAQKSLEANGKRIGIGKT